MDGNGMREKVAAAGRYLKAEGAAEVWLFGSQASGRATERSDVDLVVVGMSLDLYPEIVGVVRGIVGSPLDMVWMTKRQFELFFMDTGQTVRRLA